MSTLVTQFCQQLQKVSLQDPHAAQLIGEMYSPYASAALLSQWEANPAAAPGRETSSPWPDHIQVDSMQQQPDGSYVVHGDVIEISSQEVAHGGIASQYPVTITLQQTGNQWLISGFSRQ